MTTDTVMDDVWSHNRVCSNCFRLRHTETPVPDWIEALSSRTGWADAVTPRWTRTRHAHSDAPSDAPLGDSVSDHKLTTVCECGVVDASTREWSPKFPLDLRTMITYTDHLSGTLDALAVEACEHGDERTSARFAHERDALFDAVRHLKTTPKHSRKDARIFAVGVEVATRRRDEPLCGTNAETDRTG